MSTFGILLKTYRERAGISQTALAAQAGLSVSTISRVESGERGALGKRKQVMALAKALGLKQAEIDALLSAADLAPSTAPELSLHPRDETLYRIAQELESLRNDPQISPAQIRFVEESLLLILRGARAALPLTDLAVVPSGRPMARSLSEEERYLDDLLGECIAGEFPSGAPKVLAEGLRSAPVPCILAGDRARVPFAVFAAVARSPRWELKRRLAEALPALLGVDVEWTVPLIETLRDDPPDPEWRTDIRRRVIEAIPALWKAKPEAVASLLRWREGDEVYAVLAALDTLADIDDQSLFNEIRPGLLAHVEEKDRPAVALYAGLLDNSVDDPDAAIEAIHSHQDDGERLVRICMARSLCRLLPSRSAETLKLMRTFLRRENGQPAEHQNVRRAVARHPTGLIALLDGPYDESALALLRTLTADQDVHIRRAICDALSDLVAQSPKVALDLIEEYLLHDRDRFVHERTWNALRQLMGAGSERAEELCARLIEIA